MPKFPYSATITAKVLNADGSTTFTYQVKDGNAVIKQTDTITIQAADSLELGLVAIKQSVAYSIFADLVTADVAVGATFSFQPQDVA